MALIMSLINNSLLITKGLHSYRLFLGFDLFPHTKLFGFERMLFPQLSTVFEKRPYNCKKFEFGFIYEKLFY